MSVEIKVPALGESISEAVVAKWLKKPGDFVSLDEPILELETDKVTVSLPSPESGTLDSLVQEGTTVKIGQSVGVLTPGQKSKASGTPLASDKLSQEIKKVPPASLEQPKAVNDTTSRAKTADIKTAPLSLTPSQRKSFYSGNLLEIPSMETSNLTPMKPAQTTQQAKEEVVLMSPLRKKIAERLIEAQNSAAILTTFNEVDMSAIMSLRQKHQDSFTKKHGIKLGFMSFFSKAAVYALQSYPGLNAEIRGDQIVYKKRYDLGIAVGSGKGLVVPVVRGVDTLSLAGIEKEIARLAQKVKENTLTLEDLSSGTFTITNGGIYGSMMSTPILNMPQTGILGMHNIIKRPVCIDDKIEIRPMMYLALSYDHRVVDGREAVQFLVHIKELLESPEQMLLQS